MKCVFLPGIMSIFELFVVVFLFFSMLNICVTLPSDSFARLISEAERQGRDGEKERERKGGVSGDDNVVVNLWDCG